MKVYLVPQEYIKDIYPDIDKYVDRLVPTSHGRFDKIDLLNDILSGKASLWTIVDEDDDNKINGIIFTEITIYPRIKMLSISYAAADRLNEWMKESLVTLENWAVDNGCNSMEVTGRRGWVKKLDLHNWHEEFVIVRKDNLKKDNLRIVTSEKKDGEKQRKQRSTASRIQDLPIKTA